MELDILDSLVAHQLNNSLLALVDCNNFFVSCERVFNPSLKNKPVAVLSNNDGCIIARSNEVKDLKIPMGALVFKYQDIINVYNVKLFSANFALYGDLSWRVMECLKSFTNKIEIYSIDEAFLNLERLEEPEKYGETMARQVLQWTGVPVTIGIAKTKTLTKVASEYAKKNYLKSFCLVDQEKINQILKDFPIEDIWGVGRKWSQKLKDFGIFTGLDLKNTNQKFIRQKFNVLLGKTYLELNNISCIELEESLKQKKSLVVSRSFGKKVSSYNELLEAISSYTERAAIKLRQDNLKAESLTIYIRTNHFSKIDQQYRNSKTIKLDYATNDTAILIGEAAKLLQKIFRPNFCYAKAGVLLTGLIKEQYNQYNLFFKPTAQDNSKLLLALDKINRNYGRNTLLFASSGLKNKKNWLMKSTKKSRNYTRNWQELLTVK